MIVFFASSCTSPRYTGSSKPNPQTNATPQAKSQARPSRNASKYFSAGFPHWLNPNMNAGKMKISHSSLVTSCYSQHSP